MTSTPIFLILVPLNSLIIFLFSMIFPHFSSCPTALYPLWFGLSISSLTSATSATLGTVQFQPQLLLAWHLGDGNFSFLTWVPGMYNLCYHNKQLPNLSSSCLGLIYSPLVWILTLFRLSNRYWSWSYRWWSSRQGGSGWRPSSQDEWLVQPVPHQEECQSQQMKLNERW